MMGGRVFDPSRWLRAGAAGLLFALGGSIGLVGATADGRSPDFDGDGSGDLAVGAPFTRAGARAAGAAHVFYGDANGIGRIRHEAWRLGRGGLPGPPRRGDNLGWAVAAGDFDGDRLTDLAVSARWRRIGRAWQAGAVFILRGTGAGLAAAGKLSQDSRGVGDRAERMDAFGTALVAADFDGDGFDDLAIGTPLEDRGRRDAGVVNVVYGSPDGLEGSGGQVLTQASRGIADRPEAGDAFGRSLAAGDFDADGFDDLAVGVPYERRRAMRQGIVHVIRGSRRGLVAAGSQVWSQDAPGMAEHAERRDQFGQSLAAGDIDGDRFDDLIVGAWWEDFRNDLSNEGGFHVIYGTRAGLSARGNQFWSQATPGVADRTSISDNFGQALGMGDLDGDGFDDLAVGIPSADHGHGVHGNQGAVHVFFGSRRGPDVRRDRYLTQRSPGIVGGSERFDHMGESVSMSDLDADGRDDLIVGIPWEDGRWQDDGAVLVIPGSATGILPRRSRLLTARGADVPVAGARLGWSLTGTRADSDTSRTQDPKN